MLKRSPRTEKLDLRLTPEAKRKIAAAAEAKHCSLTDFVLLSASSVAFAEAPERMRKGLAQQPLPVMLLARLAIDTRWQGKRIGASLLKDASMRAIETSSIAGVRALVVQAKRRKGAQSLSSFWLHRRLC